MRRAPTLGNQFQSPTRTKGTHLSGRHAPAGKGSDFSHALLFEVEHGQHQTIRRSQLTKQPIDQFLGRLHII